MYLTTISSIVFLFRAMLVLDRSMTTWCCHGTLSFWRKYHIAYASRLISFLWNIVRNASHGTAITRIVFSNQLQIRQWESQTLHYKFEYIMNRQNIILEKSIVNIDSDSDVSYRLWIDLSIKEGYRNPQTQA